MVHATVSALVGLLLSTGFQSWELGNIEKRTSLSLTQAKNEYPYHPLTHPSLEFEVAHQFSLLSLIA